MKIESLGDIWKLNNIIRVISKEIREKGTASICILDKDVLIGEEEIKYKEYELSEGVRDDLREYIKSKGNKVAKTYDLDDGERYEVGVREIKKEILDGIEEYVVWVLTRMRNKVLQKDKEKEEYGKIMIEYIKALQQSDGNNKSLAEELIKIVKEEEKRASRLIYFELLEIERGLRRINIYPLKSKLNTRKIIRSIDKVWR